jgi:S-adenosylmethionine/arginine decarboxylase-like enzyme
MSTDLDLLFAAPPAGADDHFLLDDLVLQEFAATDPWGMAAAIDLGGCDPARIRDPQCIEAFVVALCDLIEMKRFGEPTIVRFGADPKVSGYSLAQLIETSLVSGHFAEESDSAYIDIFSCKAYPPYRAAAFCRDWFGGQTMRVNVVLRQADRLPPASAG